MTTNGNFPNYPITFSYFQNYVYRRYFVVDYLCSVIGDGGRKFVARHCCYLNCGVFMNIIVGISGKKGSGKSLLASFLVSRHGFREYSLAAPLKTRVQSDFSLTKDHTDGKLKEVELPTGWTPRQIMIEYGAFYRKLDPDYWVNQLFERMRYSEEGPNARFVIPDVRYENEAQAIKDRGGFLVRLNRDPKLNIYPTNPLYAKEPSECSLDHYKGWDMVVSSAANRTTNQLIAVAARIVERTTSKVSGKVSDGR